MRARLAIAAAVAALGASGVALAAGGGGEPERPELRVELREWAIDASPRTLDAGAVELVTANAGRVEHELVVVRTDRPADRLPVGLEGVRPELAGEVVAGRVDRDHDHGAGSDDHLAPGRELRARVRLAPGRYVLLCPIPGHYEAGQRAALVVR